jgi:hypothetical protein
MILTFSPRRMYLVSTYLNVDVLRAKLLAQELLHT